jgi:hypothetical protein
LSAKGPVKFVYSGLAQFEIEVIYSALSGAFGYVDEQQRPQVEDTEYVSTVEIDFPIPFAESFFQIFSIDRWYKIKGLIKEIKRRRGGKRGVKALISFYGITTEGSGTEGRGPRLIFLLMNKNARHFEMAIEKIEYLVDIIPIQLQAFPTIDANIEEVRYSYDEANFKWNPHSAKYADGTDYCYLPKTKEWRIK